MVEQVEAESVANPLLLGLERRLRDLNKTIIDYIIIATDTQGPGVEYEAPDVTSIQM